MSYDLVRFHPLATFKSYEKHNYISMPVERLDVQGKLGLYLDKIYESQSLQQDKPAVFLEYDAGMTFVNREDILYAEVQQKTTTLYCWNGEYTMKWMPLSKLCSMVGDEDFVRCHKSFAVNISAVAELCTVGRRAWNVVLDTSVSGTFYENIKQKFMRKRSTYS